MRGKPFKFNRIATIYSLFFNRQVRTYRCVLENAKAEFDFSTYQSVIDIGCGTGALCKVLQEYGLNVTGSLSQTPWNLIRGMATPKQPVSHQATPSIDQSPVSVNRARFIFSEGICL